ncbi:YciI family protein [Arthrobacter sp. H5]|uniref:YciI family protein n=1 Tax=Arthrobacter sp. H5 TaxID=1267973 RepID=UPI00048585D6|nr:YciI family protein [Arthrobacter sp. H5]
MKVVVLMYEDEQVWANATEAVQEKYMAAHNAFSDAAQEKGKILAGEALQTVATATTVRRRGSQVGLTDGPFAEITEQLGGFYVLEVPDLDVAVELVKLLPEYTIELRPVAYF